MSKPTPPVEARNIRRAECLSRAIDTIGQSYFLPHLMDYLRVDVPFVGMLLLLDERNRPFHIYDTIRAAYRISLDMYLDGVYQLDPFYTRFCKQRKTCAILIRDVAPDRFHLTEYYRRYYKNMELRDELTIFTDLGDGRFLFFSIARRSSEPRFKRAELRAIQRDLPVLASVCRRHFNESAYNQESLSFDIGEDRLQFALDRFGEEALTPREHEIAVRILKGHSSKSLAREIDISPETVKIHRRNLYRKLQISSQSELFARFLATLGQPHRSNLQALTLKGYVQPDPASPNALRIIRYDRGGTIVSQRKPIAAIDIRNTTKVYGNDRASGVVALDDVSLEIIDNEFFTLLGPSGCGKTTLLRLIGGFEQPTQGEILLFEGHLEGLPPYKRPVNTVFQHYALSPHMTVAENISFGLEMLEQPADQIEATVSRVLQLVQMEHLAKRKSNQLSDGQQQRVALARALAPQPKVLLLDEPLSALDFKLRKEMQVELKRLQSETGITFIFVTHDQEEALTMSDRVAVMRDGLILQIGTPREIYDHPARRFVAYLLLALLLLASACQSVVTPAVDLPSSLVRPMPVSAGVYYDEELRNHRIENDTPKYSNLVSDLEILTGHASVELFDRLFSDIFAKTVTIEKIPPIPTLREQLNVIVEPRILQLRTSWREEGLSMTEHATIHYAVTLYSIAGERIGSWTVEGEGRTGQMTGFSSLEQAVEIAMRNAGAKLIVAIYRDPVIQKCLEREPGATETTEEFVECIIEQ